MRFGRPTEIARRDAPPHSIVEGRSRGPEECHENGADKDAPERGKQIRTHCVVEVVRAIHSIGGREMSAGWRPPMAA
jgi:hypothetical protein